MLHVNFLVSSSVGNNYPPAPEGRAPSPPTAEDDDQPPPIPGRHLPDLIQNNHSLSNQEEVSTIEGRQKNKRSVVLSFFLLVLCYYIFSHFTVCNSMV